MQSKHKHRIIPGHMGGTYEPSNVILLSVEEHAEEHRKLYEKFGRWQDKTAWMLLSKQAKREDFGMTGKGHTIETRKLMSEKRKKYFENPANRKIISDKKKGKELVLVDRLKAQALYDSGLSYKKVAQFFNVSVNKIQCLKLKTRTKSEGTQLWWNKRKEVDG